MEDMSRVDLKSASGDMRAVALRVTVATDDEIVQALKIARPLVIKSQQDLSRVTNCMRRAMYERFKAMEGRDSGIEKIPTWSLNYLVNGDATGLTEDEVEEISRVLEEHGIHEVVSPVDQDASPYFTECPLFGKPTEVEDCIVTYKNLIDIYRTL